MFSWEEMSKAYKALIADIEERLLRANEQFYRQLGYSPMESVKHRIKSEASIKRKLEKKSLQYNKANIASLHDLAGLRIICKFLDDIPEILSLIRSWQNPKLIMGKNSIRLEAVRIIEEIDYVKAQKESGYRSYHVVCDKGGLFFEIQIRTICMDFWASTEHLLKYKYGGLVPVDMAEKLSSISEISATLDMAMNDLRRSIDVGTVKSRLMAQLEKAIGILHDMKQDHKSRHYEERLIKDQDDIDKLRKLAIEAKEDIPKNYWNQ